MEIIVAIKSQRYLSTFSGADPGFFFWQGRGGGGALVSYSTSTPINHIVFFCRIPVVLKNRRSSQEGVHTPCTLPLDPPLILSYCTNSYTRHFSQNCIKQIIFFKLCYIYLHYLHISEDNELHKRHKIMLHHE